MESIALCEQGWTLRESTESDIDGLMSWFPAAEDINIWGGPAFRYPFTRDTFFEDIHWGQVLSFSLRDVSDEVVAFGQLYDRDERIHLARLVVNPLTRGQGSGRRLIELLIKAGSSRFHRDECSLFVFRKNIPAYECYKSLGFAVREYPKDMPHADVCYYLTRQTLEKESCYAS